MTYNILAYLIYYLILTPTIIKVGRICYKNGNIFVSNLVPNHEELCKSINSLLLIGYYLMNIGYTAVMINYWQDIDQLNQLLYEIFQKSAIMLLGLSTMHYFNLLLLNKYVKHLI